jgi:hypothetical protein
VRKILLIARTSVDAPARQRSFRFTLCALGRACAITALPNWQFLATFKKKRQISLIFLEIGGARPLDFPPLPDLAT